MKLLTYFLAIAMSVSLVAPVYAQDFDNEDCNERFINDPAGYHESIQNLKDCEDKADSKALKNTLYVLGGLAVVGVFIYIISSTNNSEASLMESARSLLNEKVIPKISYDADTETTHFGWTIPVGEQK